jgi:hypothetical protein
MVPLRCSQTVAAGVGLIIGLLTLSACSDVDLRPRATGPEGTITVVTDSASWNGPIGEALRSELEQLIFTLPQPEASFNVRLQPLNSQNDLDRVQRQKNIVFVAPLSDTTNTSSFIRARLDSAVTQGVREQRLGVFPRENLWYREQLVYYITGAQPEDVVRAIKAQGPTIRQEFNEITRERQQFEMFEKGRQTALEDTLMKHHDFAVNVQHDYVIAQDTSNFVRLRRVLTDTWRDFFIYYIEDADPSVLSPTWIRQVRDSLTEKYVRGSLEGSYVEIDRRRPLETENINFLDRYGFETRGIWHMTQDAMAGPFLNYTFYDEAQERIYMFDGMVFAPGYSKRDFLRQIEVIAHTFRTRQEAEQTTTASNQSTR